MTTSKFEAYSDKLLFKFLKEIVSLLEDEGINYTTMKFDEDVSGVLYGSLKKFGMDVLSYIDQDFLFVLIKRNISILQENNLTSPLDRPTCSEYSFEVNASMNVYQTEYYEHKISSYSENPYRIVITMENDGNFSYYEGKLTYTDVHDYELNNINIEKNTFYKI